MNQATETGAPRLKASIEILELDKSGAILKRTLMPGTNSWVKQFAQILRAFLGLTTDTAVKVYNGATLGVNKLPTITVMDSTAPLGNTEYGILAGTGVTAPTRDDFALQTLVAHGVGAGQLSYAASLSAAVAAVVGGYRVQLTRQLTNSSGADITLKEVGVVVKSNDATQGLAYCLILHDAVNYVVTNGAIVQINYNLDFLV